MKVDTDVEKVCCFGLHAATQHKVREGEWGEGDCSEQVEGVPRGGACRKGKGGGGWGGSSCIEQWGLSNNGLSCLSR